MARLLKVMLVLGIALTVLPGIVNRKKRVRWGSPPDFECRIASNVDWQLPQSGRDELLVGLPDGVRVVSEGRLLPWPEFAGQGIHGKHCFAFGNRSFVVGPRRIVALSKGVIKEVAAFDRDIVHVSNCGEMTAMCCEDGSIWYFDATTDRLTQKEVFVDQVLGITLCKPAGRTNPVLVLVTDSSVYAFDGLSTKVLLDQRASKSIAVSDRGEICLASGEGLRCIDVETGRTAWINKDLECAENCVSMSKEYFVTYDSLQFGIIVRDWKSGEQAERLQFRLASAEDYKLLVSSEGTSVWVTAANSVSTIFKWTVSPP